MQTETIKTLAMSSLTIAGIICVIALYLAVVKDMFTDVILLWIVSASFFFVAIILIGIFLDKDYKEQFPMVEKQ